MLVINEKTEEKLKAYLEQIKNKTNGFVFVPLKFSQLENAPNMALSVDILNKMIDDSDARIFFLSDGDIFIISKNIHQDFLTNFQDKLGRKLSNDIANIYDLDKNWSIAYMLCEEKYPEKDEAQAEKKKDIGPYLAKLEDTQSNLDHLRSIRKELKILIVEDEMFSRKLVASSLSKEYEVCLAKNGEEAISRYSTEAPNIVFLDIGLPDFNGHEILKGIIKNDKNAFIIMLSGNGDRDNVLAAVQSGAKGFVGKPFTKEKLLQYIHQYPIN